ncbi:MAG: gliding motility-associated ABC transporter ATP-binding subunit GldA [Marinilabiliales bacterium]|nr:MAG: gliding motility-associated ABC transporter ATP-binding subunit GldA [Marinilabiliales bacterium]
MSVKVENLTKIYGTQRALDNVSIDIDKGEIVGLLGPNGAGKSTLMKIITCYLPPTNGNASIDGFDIATQSMDVRKSIGYLPESNPLYYDMHVKEFLYFIAGIHGIKNKKERVAEMIELTGLQVEMKKKIGALSKGYKQRVGLAQALIHDPDVLILDEPTSGLDPNQIIEIRELIKNAGKKKTVLLSTHIMQEVEAICSRVIIIDKGKIVADDKTSNLNKLFTGPEIILVEFEKSVSKESIRKISGVKNLYSEGKNTWKIEVEPDGDVRKAIFDFAVKNDNTVLSLSKEKHSIEELFQRLTK